MQAIKGGKARVQSGRSDSADWSIAQEILNGSGFAQCNIKVVGGQSPGAGDAPRDVQLWTGVFSPQDSRVDTEKK